MVCSAHPLDNAVIEEFSIMSISPLGRRTFLTTSALLGLGGLWTMTSARADIAVDADLVIHESTSEAGFVHPGISLTAETIKNLREQIDAKADPWYTYAKQTAQSELAALEVVPRNRDEDDPTLPRLAGLASQGDNSLFISDGLLAYTQAVMFLLTGLPEHRANALEVISLWAQSDPGAFEYFEDSHIHTGVPMQRMTTAAEILRHTSAADGSSEWTDQLTESFSSQFVRPVVETFMNDNNHFMNQHTYPLLGATAAAIFLDDTALYERSVEWFTVNATAQDQGFNGSVARLFRWVDRNDQTGEELEQGRVQHVEMGRDQAHGGGDLNNAWELARMLLSQGTTVDPVDGTVSKAGDAVGPYEFLDNRILAAADYFCQYMLGEDPDWTPVAYAISPDGTIRDTYRRIATGYRGRYLTMNFWDLFYYYSYVAGLELEQVAPHFTRAFHQRFEERYHAGGSVTSAWENVDGGGDFWLHIPPAAAAEGASRLPRATPGPTEIHLADRCTVLDGEVTVERPRGEAPHLHIEGSTAPARIAVQSAAAEVEQVALRVRTTAVAELMIDSGRIRALLPDTGGQWRILVLDGGTHDHLELAVTTDPGQSVDIAQLFTDVTEQPQGPVFSDDIPEVVVGVADARLTVEVPAVVEGDQELRYSLSGLPRGARIHRRTGEIAWQRPVEGTFTAVVQADTGEAAAVTEVEVRIGVDRDEAIERASEPFDPQQSYVSWTQARLETAQELARSHPPVQRHDHEFEALLADIVIAAAELELLNPLLEDGSLDYSTLLVDADVDLPATDLVDDDPHTGPWYGQAVDLTHTFDFGPDFTVAVEKIGLQSNIFPDRLASTILLGSTDGIDWTRLTPGAAEMTQDYQELTVADDLVDEQWRYLRLQLADPQPDVLYGIVRELMELTEFHVHGHRTETGNPFEEVVLSSEAALAGKIRLGDEVQVTATPREDLETVEVTIGGQAVTAEKQDDGTYVASAPVTEAPTGWVSISVGGIRDDGSATPTLTGTTDGSTLQVGGDLESLLAIEQGEGNGEATITASHPGLDGSDERSEALLLVDGDPETFGDLAESAGSSYRIELTDGARFTLSQVYLLPRPDHPERLDGVRLQGSADGESWQDLTPELEGARAHLWSTLTPLDEDSLGWTSLRLINDAPWNGNVAELEVYGTVSR